METTDRRAVIGSMIGACIAVSSLLLRWFVDGAGRDAQTVIGLTLPKAVPTPLGLVLILGLPLLVFLTFSHSAKTSRPRHGSACALAIVLALASVACYGMGSGYPVLLDGPRVCLAGLLICAFSHWAAMPATESYR